MTRKIKDATSLRFMTIIGFNRCKTMDKILFSLNDLFPPDDRTITWNETEVLEKREIHFPYLT